MKTEGEKLNDWVINKIKTEYKDDVLLLIAHNTYKLEKDSNAASVSFFFPASEKGVGLARSFIIDGIGYDLFPMSWDRIERMTNLDEDNAACVGEATILYYRKEGDKKRFLDLQTRLQDHLHNPGYMIDKALEKVNVAMELYQTMMFEESLFKVRKAAGHIVNFLSNAVAYSNMTYFRKGYQNSTADLLAMESIPEDFMRLCQDIVQADSGDEIKKVCHKIIQNTRQFLSAKKGKSKSTKSNQNFQDLAHWYQELSYAWREIYQWCDEKDAIKAFIRGCYLQSELDIIGEEFRLGEFDMLGAFKADDLVAYRRRAENLEKKMVSIIGDHGVTLEVYDSVDEFLVKNA